MATASFQSTRPRGARHTEYPQRILLRIVSIHAPAWGATCGRLRAITGVIVSIHAPAWGATGAGRISRGRPRSFNPRARVGRDLVHRRRAQTGRVSIHAPAWGATFLHPAVADPYRGFNPRARVGRDATRQDSRECGSQFQSTRPRGARPPMNSFPTSHELFQSTRPRGARPGSTKPAKLSFAVSIHAPAWGATAAAAIPRSTSSMFQSTRPRGARPG